MDLNHAKTKIGELKGIKRVHGLTEVTPIKGKKHRQYSRYFSRK